MALAIAVPLVLSAAVPAGECRIMRVARPAGAVISESDTDRCRCPAEAVPAKLRYDARRGIAWARSALAKGEALGRAYLPPRPDILPGDAVELVVRIGHVSLRRKVTALQPARARQRFFAREADGDVVLAPPLVGEVSRER
jgi:flagella basal body P-ring formation protein FlgA